MRRPPNDIQRLQHSVRVFSDPTQRRPLTIHGESFYTRMLLDDVSNGLMPFRPRENPDFSIAVDPPNEEVERLIAAGIGRDRSEERRVGEEGRTRGGPD